MNINKDNVNSIDRDRFVLSKGHCSPALYATLHEAGLLEEDLKTFRQVNSKLQGHPNMNYVAGVDMSTGSLGQGVSCAVGMAIANKVDGSSWRTTGMIVAVGTSCYAGCSCGCGSFVSTDKTADIITEAAVPFGPAVVSGKGSTRKASQLIKSCTIPGLCNYFCFCKNWVLAYDCCKAWHIIRNRGSVWRACKNRS